MSGRGGRIANGLFAAALWAAIAGLSTLEARAQLIEPIARGGAVGTWISRGTTCFANGRPHTGGLLFVERGSVKGRPALRFWSDDLANGKEFGIESDVCTFHAIRPAGRPGLYEGRLSCGTEDFGRRSGSGRMQIGRNPGERVPFLAIRKFGELERYTRCRR